MRKFLIIALMALSVQGCASMNPLSLLKPDKPSIEANVQLAKNAEQEHNALKVENGNTEIKQEAEKISNDTKTEIKADIVNQITNSMTLDQMITFIIMYGAACFCVGVLCPDVPRLYGAIKYVIKDVFYGIIVKPIKGVFDYFRKPDNNNNNNNNNNTEELK
ncbi:hypothetical protein COPG_00041 [Colwellia phage 9A]|uniref:Lipoprotein n=1 Tax=Colwellia phage 9A TaxID=765765 RepID=I3UMC2_9CAUD|nr:hypothetical protein COPG_00041 [Colwellia phage 9A]AFK66637.1 hypothetical protein COPG_00041 [Colwellia phage 9A]